MKKLVMFIATFAISLAGAGMALAHHPATGSDCDTWSRQAHALETPSPSATEPTHHDEDHLGAVNYDNLNDTNPALPNQPLPNGTFVHTSSGHYLVETGPGTHTDTGDYSYVEVVGGGQYQGAPYLQKMGEGGYVQGRVNGNGTPATGNEVDFHVNTFGPVSEGSNALFWNSHAEACVSYNGTKQSVATTVPCPMPSSAPNGAKCQ